MKIQVSVPCNRDVPWEVANSLVATGLFMRKINPAIELEVVWITNCSIVEKARDIQVDVFLKDPKNDVLFFLDSDIVFNPKDLLRLVGHTKKHPIVGAAYPQKKYPIEFPLQFKENEDGIAPDKKDVDADGLLDVWAMGLGFTAVKRIVLEKLSEQADRIEYAPSVVIPHIFHSSTPKRVFRGEDFTFYNKCRDLGYFSKLDVTIQLGHVGSHVYHKNLEEK